MLQNLLWVSNQVLSVFNCILIRKCFRILSGSPIHVLLVLIEFSSANASESSLALQSIFYWFLIKFWLENASESFLGLQSIFFQFLIEFWLEYALESFLGLQSIFFEFQITLLLENALGIRLKVNRREAGNSQRGFWTFFSIRI